MGWALIVRRSTDWKEVAVGSMSVLGRLADSSRTSRHVREVRMMIYLLRCMSPLMAAQRSFSRMVPGVDTGLSGRLD
jgi:hypothetical protein